MGEERGREGRGRGREMEGNLTPWLFLKVGAYAVHYTLQISTKTKHSYPRCLLGFNGTFSSLY